MQFINLGKLFDGQGLSEIVWGTFKGFSSLSSMDNIRKELFNTQMKIGTDGISEFTMAQIQAKSAALGLTDTLTTEAIALAKDANLTAKAATGKLTWKKAIQDTNIDAKELGETLLKSNKLEKSRAESLQNLLNSGQTEKYKQGVMDAINSVDDLGDSIIDLGRIGQQEGSALSNMFTGFVGTIKPLLPVIAAVGAALLALTAINYATHDYTRAIDNAKKAANEYEQEKLSVESLNSEYDNLQSKIQELQALYDNGTISMEQENELANLKRQSEELETQLQLQKEILAIKAQASVNAAQNASNTEMSYIEAMQEKYGKVQGFFMGLGGYFRGSADNENISSAQSWQIQNTTEQGRVQMYLDDLAKYEEALKNVEASLLNDPTNKNYQDAQERLNKQILDTKQNLSDSTSLIQGWINQSTDANGQILKGAEDAVDSWRKTLTDIKNYGKSKSEIDFNNLNLLFSSSTGKNLKQILNDVAKSGGNAEDALEQFKQVGLSLNSINVSEEGFKRYFQDIVSSAQEASEAMKTLSDTESIGAVTKALETDDAGANYEKAVSSAEKIRELLDQGLVGKDEFKAFSDYLSYGMDDSYEAYQNGIDKFNRYFTTDSSSGVQNFINDLVAKSDELGTSWAKVNEAGDGWVFNIDNTAKAAKEMGISVGMIEDIFGRLQDYGFEIDWHSALSDLNTYSDALSGIKDIYDDMGDTVSKDRLGKLIEGWDQEFLGFQQDLSTLTDEQIVKIKFEYDLASLQLTIDELQDKWNLGNTSAEAGAELLSSKKAYREKREEMTGYDEADSQGYEAASNKILSLQASFNENMTKAAREATQNQISAILDMQNAFQDAFADGETPDWETFLGSDKAKTVMDKIMSDTKMTKKELASLFNLDESFFETEPVHIKLEGEINQSELESQIQNMTFGSTITFNADVQGAEQEVNVIKKLDGSITYVALVDNIPTEVEPVKHQNGTISYEPITNDVEAEASKTDGGTRETNFNPNTESVDAETAKTDGGVRIVTYKPDTSLLPESLPPIYQTVYQNVVRKRATGSMFAPAHATGTTGYNVVNTISGSAYVNGQVSLPYDERALVNELGRESFIRDGKWMLLPPGMHLQDFKKGDIILSASQTEALMKYGRASGKGNAYANGTIPPSVLTHAYAGGMNGGGSFKGGASSYNPSGSGSSGYSNNNNNNNNNNSSVSNEEAKDTADTLDWIETLLKRIQDAIESLGKKASSVFKTWKNRNSALVEQMKKVNEELALQEQAYNRYLAETEPIGLSDHYKELVRNGAIDIELVSDETLKENIQNFQTWYEKALECEKALEDLKETAAELNKTKFDNVVSEFEQLLNKFNYQKNMMDEYMNQMAAHGYQTSTRYYQSKLIAESNSIKELEKQRNAMLVEFESAMLSGTIEKGSEAWYDMANQIDEVTVAIEEGHTAMLEYKKEIRDIEWGYFDLLQERITQITNEAEFLIDLMGNKKLYDDKGQLTDEGMATMGLYGQNYNVYMEQSKRYAEEIKRIDKELADDPYNQDLINRRNELLEQQREMILSAEQQKDAIVNLVKEGIELELESLKKLIDETNEALNLQKDLFDYQRRVTNQTRSLLELQKALSAYQGDDSEEAKVIKQQLQVNIEKAQQELQETEYDKYISDQQKLLDSLYDEYELILNSRLDNIDALVADMITEINSNASSINSTLEEQASSVGITLSSEMQDIWGGTDGIKTVLTFYGTDIANSIVDAGTTINSTLGTINTNLSNMIEQLNKIAGTNIKAASTSEAEVSKEANAQKPQPKPEPTPEPEPESKADFFIYRKSEYPKDQLNKDTSIVDRLAYNDFDWSFDARKLYYNKMGFSGEYVSSAEQNIGMLNWMKLNGYKKGLKHADKDEWAWTQENGEPEVIIRPSDGAILTPVKYDDSILNSIATENIFEFANNPGKFIDNLGNSLDNTPNILNSVANNNNSLQNVVNGDIKIVLPNVKSYEDFKHDMQHDPNFEKMIQAMTVGRLLGGSRLDKYKYK